MGPKHDPRDILKLALALVHDQDFDLLAGSGGMTPAQAAARYFRSPGHFLALLRFFRKESVEDVARETAKDSPEAQKAVEAERERLQEALKVSGGCLWCRREAGHSKGCMVGKAFKTV